MKVKSRLVAGCMTGTSIDGVDAALVKIEGEALSMRAELIDTASLALGELRQDLQNFASGQKKSAAEITLVVDEFTKKHNEVLDNLLKDRKPDLIAVHGQTVYHKPPHSWQIINAHRIAAKFNSPVLFDLRGADLAHGGEGAPITPIADHVMFRSKEEKRAIVNLGGFCNYTLLPEDEEISSIRGGDICVCNQLLDKVCQDLTGEQFDKDGKMAASGQIVTDLLDQLSMILEKQTDEGRSLGTYDSSIEIMDKFYNKSTAPDILRTVCHAIGKSILKVFKADRIILAGGGCHNKTLVSEIVSQSDQAVDLSDMYGVPVSFREAMGLAVLGALSQDRITITLKQITYAHESSVAGSWILP